MPSVFLIGGGWSPRAIRSTYGEFIAAAGPAPRIACVLLDEPGHEQYFARFAEVLSTAGASGVRPVFVGPRHSLRLADLEGADGVFVGGGLTPGYRDSVAGVCDSLGAWLAENGVPYAGFSAGAAIAARTAIIGGWKMPCPNGLVAVCPEEVGEDLDEVRVTHGLDLVPFAVDVHAGAWGTLSRLVAVVNAGLAAEGWAVDEDTMLAVRNAVVTVHGAGRAYHVRATEAGVTTQIVAAGATHAVAGH